MKPLPSLELRPADQGQNSFAVGLEHHRRHLGRAATCKLCALGASRTRSIANHSWSELLFKRFNLFYLWLALPVYVWAQTPSPTIDPTTSTSTETIVLLRHGEKPAREFGQLSCAGLNRALALPQVLISKYGKADFIFAPDPTSKIGKEEVKYSYVRPLAAIEPTAIQLGLSVETKFGYREIEQLQKELLAPKYQRSVIFVVWEHNQLVRLVKNLLATFGTDSATVPDWKGDDYDSIYVVRIQSNAGQKGATFQHDQEGLNGLSKDCPEPKR